MVKRNNSINMLFFALLPLCLIACGGGGSGDPDVGSTGGGNTGDFIIISRAPAVDAINQSLSTQVVINFNKALIPVTVDSNAIYVSQGNQRLSISIIYSAGDTLVLINFPQPLSPDTVYTVGITSDLMSDDGTSFDTHQWNFVTAGNSVTAGNCMSISDIDMLSAVNAARAQGAACGPAVPPLAWNCQLQQAALRHSTDMDTNNFNDHTGSDGSNPGDRITDAGYQWSGFGENIAWGYTSITTVMDAWLNSPGHCANIMSSGFTEFGSAEVNRSWTQNFGRPR